jgi:hypothetical protein
VTAAIVGFSFFSLSVEGACGWINRGPKGRNLLQGVLSICSACLTQGDQQPPAAVTLTI